MISEIKADFYHAFISSPDSLQLTAAQGTTQLKLVEIHLEDDATGPLAIVDAEFRYLFVTNDGYLDQQMFASFMQAGIKAMNDNTINDPQGEYRTRFFWQPTHDEFKTLMSLALQNNPSLPCPIMESHRLPIDQTSPEINGIRKLLDVFPGLQVIGTNRSLNYWTITFDIVNLNGLISYQFIKQGLQHDLAKELSITLTCPEEDMRYVISCTVNDDTKKVGMWLIFIYQKRLEYKDIPKNSG